jgi:hypothetical protein
MNDRAVQREARDITSDLRGRDDEHGLSDAEAECLRDLLQRSDAFGELVRAQQAAVRVEHDMDGVDESVHTKAHDGAYQCGEAIDQLVQHTVGDAESIITLARELYDDGTWGPVVDVYRAGYQSVENLQAADLQQLIADAGMHPAVAEEIVEAADTLQEDDSQDASGDTGVETEA